MMKDIDNMNNKGVIEYYDSPTSKLYRNLSYFKIRINHIRKLLQKSVGKSVLDIGAGDCFWAKYFIDELDLYIIIEKGRENCSLIESNFNSKKVYIINDDAFKYDYLNVRVETLFFSFFMSHFHFSSIIELILKINQNVNFDKIIILDSFWSDYRKRKFGNNVLMLQKRVSNEKGDIVEIPKRFISIEDLKKLSEVLSMTLEMKYLDEYWCFAILKR